MFTPHITKAGWKNKTNQRHHRWLCKKNKLAGLSLNAWGPTTLLIFLHRVFERKNNSFPQNTFNPPVHFVLSMSREPVLQVHLHKYILISTKRQRCFKHLWLCLSCSQGFAACLSKPRKLPTCPLNSRVTPVERVSNCWSEGVFYKQI